MTDVTPQSGLLRRFIVYQKERFPFIAHGPLIGVFTFSAISYSRICRGAEGFVDLKRYLVAAVTTITLFFLVRVFDEFKDKEDDARWRKHLPVPRGLISLKELSIFGAIAVAIQLVVNIWFFPQILPFYLAVIGYLCLMGKEFFIGEWLKKHQLWYVLSHMVIIPLVDIYASAMDWRIEGAEAPTGLYFFFVVSFMNGIVLEVGRKIRTPEKEEHNTYSTMMGMNKATWLWIGVLCITFLASVAAALFAGYGSVGVVVLAALLCVCAYPGLRFLKDKSARNAQMIEYASGAWTAGMYLSLGGIPMLLKLLGR